jgi:nucleotide-binding universal stress UspA family protein
MYKRIVVGTDGSAGAGMAVDAAVQLARLTGASLHIVSAHKTASAYQFAGASEVGLPLDAIAASNEAIHSEALRSCAEAADRASSAGVSAETHCVAGDPADALLKVAQDADCDLLVVGNRGMSGVRRFVLGSVPNKLSHQCTTNLLIIDTSAARS